MEKKEAGLSGPVIGTYYGQEGVSRHSLAADRAAGQWAMDQQQGGGRYELNPVPEELLHYRSEAVGDLVMGQAVQPFVVGGELIKG